MEQSRTSAARAIFASWASGTQPTAPEVSGVDSGIVTDESEVGGPDGPTEGVVAWGGLTAWSLAGSLGAIAQTWSFTQRASCAAGSCRVRTWTIAPLGN